MNWTGQATSSDQGLIIDDETGKNIAVAYDPKHTNLIAAAPELLAEGKALLQALREIAIHPSHYSGLSAAIAKAQEQS